MEGVVGQSSSERGSLWRRVKRNSAHWTEIATLARIISISVVCAADANVRRISVGINNDNVIIEVSELVKFLSTYAYYNNDGQCLFKQTTSYSLFPSVELPQKIELSCGAVGVLI